MSIFIGGLPTLMPELNDVPPELRQEFQAVITEASSAFAAETPAQQAQAQQAANTLAGDVVVGSVSTQNAADLVIEQFASMLFDGVLSEMQDDNQDG